MNTSIVVLGAIIAVGAGLRGLWSPCGLSMLSTITPLAERTRRQHYGVTAGWFVVGAVAGGLCLGALGAALAWLVSVLAWPAAAVLAVTAAAALVGAVSDLRLFGFHLPLHPRQVNETWLGRYRGWIYGCGFGFQIGLGLATYIMTAATYLVVVLGALTASPVAALALGGIFGLVRGLGVFASSKAHTPEALLRMHQRLDGLAPTSKRSAIALQAAVALAAIGLAAGIGAAPAIAISVGVAAAVAAALRFTS